MVIKRYTLTAFLPWTVLNTGSKHANSVFAVDGIKYRVETRAAKIAFATMFADVAKDKGYNIYMPAMYKLNNITL